MFSRRKPLIKIVLIEENNLENLNQNILYGIQQSFGINKEDIIIIQMSNIEKLEIEFIKYKNKLEII